MAENCPTECSQAQLCTQYVQVSRGAENLVEASRRCKAETPGDLGSCAVRYGNELIIQFEAEIQRRTNRFTS